MNAKEPQKLRDEYFRATKILDAECKQVSASLNNVIKTTHDLHVKGQQKSKISTQKYGHHFD
jgi:hypothetical protein